MQNIHVKRYRAPQEVGYKGLVEPEDRSWLLFVPVEGDPQLFVRGEMTTCEGKVEHHLFSVHELGEMEATVDEGGEVTGMSNHPKGP